LFPYERQFSLSVLPCYHMLTNHSFATISLLDKAIGAWSLEGKVVGMTSDQGSNIKKSLREQEDRLGAHWIPCTSHLLQGCVNKAWDKTPAFAVIAKKCTWISNFFNGNSTARAAIKRHWTTHKHGALSARRVAIPITNSDIPASSNLSTNGDAVPPVNGNFPANDAPPVNGASPADDAPPANGVPPVNGALPVNDAPPLNGVPSVSFPHSMDDDIFFVSANVTRWNSKLHLVERVYSYRAVLEATSQELLLKRDVPSEERKKFKEFRNQLLSVEELNVLGEIIELLHPAAELTHWIGGSGYSTISQVYRKVYNLLPPVATLQTEVAPTMHMKLQCPASFRACCGRCRRSCRSHHSRHQSRRNHSTERRTRSRQKSSLRSSPSPSVPSSFRSS